MKIVGISDIHLTAKNPIARLDDITITQFDKLKYVLNWAYDNDAIIIQAGDFFNKPRSWSLLPKMIDILYYHSVNVYCVFGQHDTYFYNEQTRESTSLGILEKVDLVKSLDSTGYTIPNKGILLYGTNWGEEVPIPKNNDGETCILSIHAPISTEPLFPDHKYTSAQRFFDKYKKYYDLIICGDIHRQFHIQEDGYHLINTGPMLRITADEYNFIHCPSFIEYDTNTGEVEWHHIPHKNAKEVLTRQHIENKIQNTEMLEEFVQNLKTSFDVGYNLTENIMEYLKTNPQSKEVKEILAEVMEDGE